MVEMVKHTCTCHSKHKTSVIVPVKFLHVYDVTHIQPNTHVMYLHVHDDDVCIF